MEGQITMKEAIREHTENGDLFIEWTWGIPEVHFRPGEPLDHVTKRIGLRALLWDELQVVVPREFVGYPMAFDPPHEWAYARNARLMQALLRAYDKWEKKTL